MAAKTELPQTFRYEHCDVPDGVSLSEWRIRTVRPQRKAQIAGGVLAALATLGPILMSARGNRSRG
jgi:hypothetical protein